MSFFCQIEQYLTIIQNEIAWPLIIFIIWWRFNEIEKDFVQCVFCIIKTKVTTWPVPSFYPLAPGGNPWRPWVQTRSARTRWARRPSPSSPGSCWRRVGRQPGSGCRDEGFEPDVKLLDKVFNFFRFVGSILITVTSLHRKDLASEWFLSTFLTL